MSATAAPNAEFQDAGKPIAQPFYVVDPSSGVPINAVVGASGYVALSAPPGTTNAGSDTALTFAQQVNHIGVQNNTAANAYVHYESAASTASLLLVPGAYLREDKQLTVLHVFTAAAQAVNGANGIVVEGWL